MATIRVTVAVTLLASLALVTGCTGHKPTVGEQMLAKRDAASTEQPAALEKTVDTRPADVAPPVIAGIPATRPGTPATAAPATTPTIAGGNPAATSPVVASPVTAPTPVAAGGLTDGAFRARTWAPTLCYYQNGNTIAGPTYRILPPPARSSAPAETVFVDLYTAVLTLPQFVITPVWMFVEAPWRPVANTGVEFPPSYTVDDPKPESRQRVPGIIQLERD